MSTKQVVAAFDFDGTLTYSDSLLPFLLFTAGPVAFTVKIFRSLPVLFSYVVRFTHNSEAKEALLTRFFAGYPIEKIASAGHIFASSRLPSLLKPKAMRRLRWHQTQGHLCVLVSASLTHYLVPWAEQAGFTHVIASQLALDETGCITGRLEGGNCHGEEKARRLRNWLGERSNYLLYAYGDSAGDEAMLQMADHAYYQFIPEESE